MDNLTHNLKKKVLTHNVSPQVVLNTLDNNNISKHEVILSGVDSNDASISKINNVKVDDTGNLNVSIQSGATPAITGFSTESTLSSMSSKLPSALDGGNLKVSIQSGATPAITGFSTESTLSSMSSKLPSALDGGNLKVSIQSGATPAITGFSTESTLSSMNAKISKGEASTITGGTGGLHQTLLYGRESGGNLRALECVGDRLITTDLVFGASGPNEPTALAKIAIYGQIDATNTYKNLRVDSSGVLSVSNPNLIPTKSYTQPFNAYEITAASSSTSSAIDLVGIRHISFSGFDTADTNATVEILASITTNGVYSKVASGSYSEGSVSVISIENCAYRFIKVKITNNDATSNFTFNVHKLN